MALGLPGAMVCETNWIPVLNTDLFAWTYKAFERCTATIHLCLCFEATFTDATIWGVIAVRISRNGTLIATFVHTGAMMAPLRVVLILMQCVLGHAIPQALVRNVVEWRIPTVTTELATIAALRVPDHSTSDQSKEKIASHNDKPTSSTASESPNIPDHQILRRDVLFDSTLWDSFPVCSKTCIIENFGNVCGSKFTPSVYSQCICRENLDKENAAAENVANSCPAELNDTAVRFVDACANTNNGGSKLGVSGWMTHAKITVSSFMNHARLC